MNETLNVGWMKEPIQQVPGGQAKYRLICALLLKKRMTYAHMYVFAFAFHKKRYKNNEQELKTKILKDLAAIYYYNNKKLPDGFTINKRTE